MDELKKLQMLLEDGTLDLEFIRQQINMKYDETLLKNHPYKITKLKDGRYGTYVKDPIKGRRNIKAATKKDLEDKLLRYYSGAPSLDNTTLNDIFEDWLSFKDRITGSHNTIVRHRSHYNKYLKNTDLFAKPIALIDKNELIIFCNDLVKSYSMTRKEWINVKTVLKGLFSFAQNAKIIKTNPLEGLRITVPYRQVDKKFGDTETFNTKERKDLIAFLDREYEENGEIVYLAVKLNLYLGLRVGELTALTWGDILENRFLHINKEEIRDMESGAYKIEKHTKTRRDRYVVLVPQALEILRTIGSGRPNEMIFKNVNSRKVNYVLEKFSEESGYAPKRSHKLRKTYASVLQENGVPIDEIRKQLGHASLATTLGYLFNPLTNDETFSKITSAFEDSRLKTNDDVSLQM